MAFAGLLGARFSKRHDAVGLVDAHEADIVASVDRKRTRGNQQFGGNPAVAKRTGKKSRN